MENNVEIVSCETLMTTEYPSTQYCVETLIGTGCYIVAGVPKIGKSKIHCHVGNDHFNTAYLKPIKMTVQRANQCASKY